jgi:thiol-disulfide isomerase/thioredoxin
MVDYSKEYELLDDKNIFKEISYDELMNFLDTFNTGLIYIGGAWCNYCQAIAPYLDNIAKKYNLEAVYNYDPRFTNVFGEVEDLRDCKSLENKLKYYAIVEKIKFKSSTLVQDTLISKIEVPFIMAIKNGTCVGTYSCKYVNDKYGLHAEDDILHEDKAEEVTSAITELVLNLKANDKEKFAL